MYEAPKVGLRELLDSKGLSLAGASRAAGLDPAFLSRVMGGTRGRGLRLATACKLAAATRIPLSVLAEALQTSVAQAEEQRRQLVEVERAILEARLA